MFSIIYAVKDCNHYGNFEVKDFYPFPHSNNVSFVLMSDKDRMVHNINIHERESV